MNRALKGWTAVVLMVLAAPVARAQGVADVGTSDLTVNGTVIAASGVSLSQSHFPAGPTYPVSVTMTNLGTLPASFMADLGITFSGVGGTESFDLGSATLDLAAGASTVYSADWNTAAFPTDAPITVVGIAW